ncbi:MAG: hydrogenase formation protein HypD [Candidatus Solibacter sp.]|nr:hydrogenase formation protein HypD [Candidatus Solibacter sp.]
MKFLDEYRDGELVKELGRRIAAAATRDWTIMEVCGGQTHTILKTGLEGLLPGNVQLVHGPGCPVCVTPLELIDAAVEIALKPGAVFTSFGDMLRVPGSRLSLFDARARGADVRIVYSPLDAVELARRMPEREVVFFAVGFETTAPANAMAVWQAARTGVSNFSILTAHVLVPPAMEAVLASPECRVQAFLAPGHVCTVDGYEQYEAVAERYGVPVVVTGFEPVDLMEGLLAAVRQLEDGRAEVENRYARAVKREGNQEARRIVAEVFETSSRKWRGIGAIPNSGLKLRPAYARFDALKRFGARTGEVAEPEQCQAGRVLQGLLKPTACAAFGTHCTPDHPLGAPMVSSEGACAAYYLYGGRDE